jgi:competence protein ComEC
VWLLNQFIKAINHLPSNVMDGIYINRTELMLLYVLLGCIMLWIYSKQSKWLMACLTTLTLFLLIETKQKIENNRQQFLTIYSLRNQTLLDFVQGSKAVFLADSSTKENKFIANYRNERGIHHIHNLSIQHQNRFANDFVSVQNRDIQFANKRIKIIDAAPKPLTNRKQKVDIIILSKNANTTINELKKIFMFNQLIIDSSNRNGKATQWIQECKRLHIHYYSLLQSGAYTEPI